MWPQKVASPDQLEAQLRGSGGGPPGPRAQNRAQDPAPGVGAQGQRQTAPGGGPGDREHGGRQHTGEEGGALWAAGDRPGGASPAAPPAQPSPSRARHRDNLRDQGTGAPAEARPAPRAPQRRAPRPHAASHSPSRGRRPPCRWRVPGTVGESRLPKGAPSAAPSASGTSSQTGCAP